MSVALKLKSAILGQANAMAGEIKTLEAAADRLRHELFANDNEYAARDEVGPVILAQLQERAAAWEQRVADSVGTDAAAGEYVPVTRGGPTHVELRQTVDFIASITRPLWSQHAETIVKSLPPGITKEVRAKRNAELRAQLEAIETELETFYASVEEIGGNVTRHPKLSPKIFLKFENRQNFDSQNFSVCVKML